MIKRKYLNDKQNPANIIYPITDEQSVRDGNGVTLATKLSDLPQVKEGAALGRTAYQKPVTGIPASDIAEGVIPDVSAFITKTVNDLTNYYLKSETYTKDEIAQLLSAITTGFWQPVQSLPEASADTFGLKIYLVPSQEPKVQNQKDEFITTRTGSEGNYTYDWEQIGSTAIDLSGFVTTEALNATLANYVTSSAFQTALAGKQDTISDLATIRSGATAGATAYQKPSSGIPESDLSSGIIEKLNKLEIFWAIYGTTTASEIQTAIDSGKLVLVKTDDSDNEVGMLSYYGSSSYFFIVPYYNGLVRYQLSNNVWSKAYVELQKTSDLVTSWNTTPSDLKYPSEKLVKDSLDKKYVKPTSGIPSSDLALAVQTLLGKADTALQSFTETDPTVPSWAKAQNPPTELFVATYGTTTFAEVKAAYQAGKLCVCDRGGNYYVFAIWQGDDAPCYFSCGMTGRIFYLRLHPNNTWYNSSYVFEQTSNKASTITGNESDTTKYPNIKAVADYIADKADIFWATYGTTTIAEVRAAISAGKFVVTLYDGYVYVNNYYDSVESPGSDSYYFSCLAADEPIGYWLVLDSTGWSNDSFTLENANHRVSSWQNTPDNEHYPSEKLVKDSLDAKYEKPSGGIPASDLAAGVIPNVSALTSTEIQDIWDNAMNPNPQSL